jgi:putative membrane protein
MTQEALLAYAHIVAIFTMIVFLTSEAALCRAEWLNATIVERLAKVDMIYGISAVAVLLTGLARIFYGAKGAAYYGHNPLLYVKVALFVLVALMSIPPTIAFIRWRRALRANGSLPAEAEVKRVRKLVMAQAHIIPIVPLAAVFLARGYGS